MKQINLNQNIDSIFLIQIETNKTIRSLKYRKKLIQKILNWILENELKIKCLDEKEIAITNLQENIR